MIVVIIQLCKAKVLFPQTQVIVVIMELCKAKVLFPQTQVIVANFGYPVWVLLNYLIFQSFMFEHTRNASCALNLKSTIFFLLLTVHAFIDIIVLFIITWSIFSKMCGLSFICICIINSHIARIYVCSEQTVYN